MFSYIYHSNKFMHLLLRPISKSFRYDTTITLQSFHTFFFERRTIPLLCIKQNDFYNVVNNKRMAGHAKWQNVKHVKAEKDRQKQLICNKYAFLIGLAVREGGADPKVNSKLASLLEQAKKNNVPSSTLENALKRNNNKKTKFGSVEILSPGGCFIVLEFETDNISQTRHEIKTACKKHGASVLSGEGRWRAVYEQKGIIKAVQTKSGEPLDAEKALDIAIEAGAEEVNSKDDEASPYLEFLCAPGDLNQVKKTIEQQYEVEDSYVGYLPIVTVELDKETSTVVDNLLEDLGSLPDVVRIYENVK